MSRHVLVLIGLCALTFFVGLGRPPITDSDEAFYAESAREMVESGDWITPHFNYVPRFEKPILYYWLAAGAYLVAGVGEASARFPSALAGLGLTLLTFAGARRWFDGSTGVLAGVVTATSFGYVMMSRQALPDLPLAFLITLTTWAALVAWLDDPAEVGGRVRGTGERRWWLVVAAAAGAGAFLTKGPVGIAIPALIVLPLLGGEVWSGRSTWRVRGSDVAIALLVFLVLATPWFLSMTLVHGVGYLDRFFIEENLERFATTRYNDPRPLWYYLPIVFGGMLPWSPFMLLWLPAIGGFVGRQRRIPTAELRLIWWALAPLLLFTVSTGKQPRYILPILPPLAILLARTIHRRLQATSTPDRFLGACAGLTGVLLLIAGGLALHARPLFLDWNTTWTTGVALAVVFSGLAVLIAAWRRTWTPHALVAATIVTGLGIHLVLLSAPGPAPVERMAEIIADAQPAITPYGRLRVFNRNLGFYTERQFVELSALDAARDFLSSPTRVLCVLLAEDVDRLEAAGVSLVRLGETTYLNTGTLNFRAILDPDPVTRIRHVVLVANR